MKTWSPVVRRPGRIPFRELSVPGRINEGAWILGMRLGTIITPSKPFAPDIKSIPGFLTMSMERCTTQSVYSSDPN